MPWTMLGSRSRSLPIQRLVGSVLYRSKVIDAAAGMFIAAEGIAMWLYPGGTWWDPNRTGYSFWQNFLCDLLHRRTLGGQPNLTGSRIAVAGFLALTVAILAAFSLAPEILPTRRALGKTVARLGSAGSLLLVLTALTRSDAYPRLHSLAVVFGGLPVLVAFSIWVGALLLEPETTKPFRALSLFVLISSVVAMTLYAWGAFLHGPSLRALPAIERAANIGLLIWLLMAARFVRRRLFAAYIAIAARKAASRG